MTPSKQTKRKHLYRILNVGGAALLIALLSLFVTFIISMRRWDNQLATLIATDQSISAPGDGAHAIMFVEEELLQVGQSATLGDIRVTLLDTKRERLPVENEVDYGIYGHWSVEFLVQNMSSELKYGIHPDVYSQMQYTVNGVMVWELSTESDCSPPIEEVVPEGLQPGVGVVCRFIYVVPLDDRDLYWVYSTSDSGPNGYQEIYAAYRVPPP